MPHYRTVPPLRLARSPALLDEWTRYRRRYPYATDIPFDRPIAALRTLLAPLA